MLDLSPRTKNESGKTSAQKIIPSPDDKLSYTRVSINYLMGIHKAIVYWQTKAPQVHVATLVMEGEHDPIAKPGSVRMLFDLLATKDKEFDLCPDVMHSLLDNANRWRVGRSGSAGGPNFLGKSAGRTRSCRDMFSAWRAY